VQDSLGREDSSAAQAEDAKFEDRRGFIVDPVVDAGVGATEDAKTTQPEKTEDSG